MESTLAISGDQLIQIEFGSVRVVNGGYAFTFRDNSRPVREIDGLLVADSKRLVLMNSSKLAPTGEDAGEARDAAYHLYGILSGDVPVTNLPRELETAKGFGVVPLLSGNYFTKAALQAAVEKNVIPVVVSGRRFQVSPAWSPRKILDPGVFRGATPGRLLHNVSAVGKPVPEGTGSRIIGGASVSSERPPILPAPVQVLGRMGGQNFGASLARGGRTLLGFRKRLR